MRSAVGLHRNHFEFGLRQAAKIFGQLGVHLIGVVLIKLEDLFARKRRRDAYRQKYAR